MSDDELIERAAQAASIAWENADDGPDEWPSVVRAVLAAAQPAPSVPAGAEVAEVLAKYWRFSLDRDYVRSADADLAELLDDLVGSQRQAATGARAAGGEPKLWPGPCSECGAGKNEPCLPGCANADEPTQPPPAPGVAELLAELTDRERAFHGRRYDPVMSFTEIRRYLAPGGADGGQS